MMWEGTEEPLFEERIQGELVRFLWRQEGSHHFIRAEWSFGKNPWEMKACNTENTQRHLAIEEATKKIEQIINEVKNR